MRQTADRIARLRASLVKNELPGKHARVPLGHGAADESLKGGLARGALHEVFAQGGHEASATGFAAGLAWRAAAGKPILWIRQDYCALEFGELAATGLLELGIDPSRLLVLCAAQAQDALRAASDALGCAALGAVVIELYGEPRILDLVASRRLTLAAAQKDVTALLLRFGASAEASTAETRWLIRASPSPEENRGGAVFESELVRNRHGGTGHWVMEWNCDERCFRDPQTPGGAVVAAAGDRPAAAPPQEERRSAA